MPVEFLQYCSLFFTNAHCCKLTTLVKHTRKQDMEVHSGGNAENQLGNIRFYVDMDDTRGKENANNKDYNINLNSASERRKPPAMANASPCVFLFISCLLIASLFTVSVDAGGDLDVAAWMPAKAAEGGGCQGSIAECMASGEEFEMDTESNRRILATSNYISYGALQRGNTPCSRRGSSYYNCQPGAQANPYTRGCSAITRCRSS
nr:rapid alkalinization factor [Ipomoea batatas]